MFGVCHILYFGRTQRQWGEQLNIFGFKKMAVLGWIDGTFSTGTYVCHRVYMFEIQPVTRIEVVSQTVTWTELGMEKKGKAPSPPRWKSVLF
jgi:hypothetical protein